jgi:nitrogen regulatory protein P-II 2
MPVTTLKLVTIICEPVLESKIEQDLKRLGASGYTATEGRGAGSRGLQADAIPGSNVRIEAIVAPAAADRIIAWIADHYFEHYSVVAWLTDVQVVRGEKYVSA